MSAVEWVERRIGRTLNPDQARCVQVLCSFAQPYNLQLIGDGWQSALRDEPWDEYDGDYDDIPLVQPVVLKEKYLVVNLLGSLATFDFPELTRLVLAGHEHAVRVEITPKLYRQVDTDGAYQCECAVDLGDDATVDPNETAGERAMRRRRREDQLRSHLTEHEDGCRDGEHPTGPGACLQVSFHARNRERGDDGHNWDWHPTIEQVISRG